MNTPFVVVCLTLAIWLCLCTYYFVQLRIAKVKQTTTTESTAPERALKRIFRDETWFVNKSDR